MINHGSHVLDMMQWYPNVHPIIWLSGRKRCVVCTYGRDNFHHFNQANKNRTNVCNYEIHQNSIATIPFSMRSQESWAMTKEEEWSIRQEYTIKLTTHISPSYPLIYNTYPAR